MESLRKAFLIADTDGNGFLSWEETRKFFSSVNFNPSEVIKDEFKRKISSIERGELVDKIVFKVNVITRLSFWHKNDLMLICFLINN